jgi:acetyltransferase-like isoleucine patch superfamily enzyme
MTPAPLPTPDASPAPPAAPAAGPAPAARPGAREALKALARGVAAVVVSPLLLSYWASAPVLGRDRALEGATELLSLLPGVTGRYLRRAFLARVLVRCHPTAEIGFGTIFSKAGAAVDENVYIGPRCHIGLAHLERDALLAAGVHVTSGARTHGTADPSRPIREQPGASAMVRVGAGAWVGSAAVVMADVGRGTVVGAGAVVTRPLPDGVVAVGVPAVVLRSRDRAAPAP